MIDRINSIDISDVLSVFRERQNNAVFMVPSLLSDKSIIHNIFVGGVYKSCAKSKKLTLKTELSHWGAMVGDVYLADCEYENINRVMEIAFACTCLKVNELYLVDMGETDSAKKLGD